MVRYKNRYLLVELSFSSTEDGACALRHVNARSLVALLREAMLILHGDYGLACVQRSLTVKYLNVLTRVAIVRCAAAYHSAVRSAVSTITCVEKAPCTATVIYVGGTIRCCQRFLVKHNQKKLNEMVRTAKTPVEKRALKEKVDAILKQDRVPIKV